jgi:hypothetical protein
LWIAFIEGSKETNSVPQLIGGVAIRACPRNCCKFHSAQTINKADIKVKLFLQVIHTNNAALYLL